MHNYRKKKQAQGQFLRSFGANVGLVTTNATGVEQVMNYSVVPDEALKVSQLKNGEVLTTRTPPNLTPLLSVLRKG